MTAPAVIQQLHAQFLKSRKKYEEFVKKHKKLMDELEIVRSEYNADLEEFRTAYKERYEEVGAQYGEFSLTITKEIDPYLLADTIGLDQAQELGVIEMSPKVDRKKYNLLKAHGGILPPDIDDQVMKVRAVVIRGPRAV